MLFITSGTYLTSALMFLASPYSLISLGRSLRSALCPGGPCCWLLHHHGHLRLCGAEKQASSGRVATVTAEGHLWGPRFLPRSGAPLLQVSDSVSPLMPFRQAGQRQPGTQEAWWLGEHVLSLSLYCGLGKVLVFRAT